ncbi:hypothetical protein ACHAP8_008293 [Fusarium lateritium]
MKRTTTWGTELLTLGLPATQYMSLNGSEPSCMDTWTNPMENIIEAAREISFRASMQYAAENTTNSQTTEFKKNIMQSVYETDYSKMAIALLVSMAGMLATLQLFWGFWELGRRVSLNPFEVVIAFLGMPETHPVMGKIDPNMNVGNILKSTESIGPVRYGVWSVNGRPRLGFAQADVVAKVYPDIPGDGIPGIPTLPAADYRPGYLYGTQGRRIAAYLGDSIIIAHKRLTSQIWTASDLNVHSYRFDIIPASTPDIFGVSHVQEIPFVFFNLEGVGYNKQKLSPWNGTEKPFENKGQGYFEAARLMSSS